MAETQVRMGRPRDPSRDVAILRATLDLLGQVGYEDVTVRAIAHRSGTGLATIYRRWPTKEDLVVDAVTATFPPELAQTDDDADPVESIVRIAKVLVDLLQGPHPRLIPNLLGQMAANPPLADVVRSRIIAPRLEAVVTHLRAVPGLDADQALERAELIPGWILLQALMLGRRVTDADLRRLITVVVGMGA